jgi:hypothetical protein
MFVKRLLMVHHHQHTFTCDFVCVQMLAMKFLHYQQDHSHLAAGEDEGSGTRQQQQQQQLPGKAPASLYNLAAAMIKVGCRLCHLSCVVLRHPFSWFAVTAPGAAAAAAWQGTSQLVQPGSSNDQGNWLGQGI